MLAQITPFELLALVLVMGSLSALCGYAGGAGARLLFAMRLDKVEGVVFALLNRAKGAAGGVVSQLQKKRATSADQEAEILAARLQEAGRAPRRSAPWFRQPQTPADLAEEQSFAEIEAAKGKGGAA